MDSSSSPRTPLRSSWPSSSPGPSRPHGAQGARPGGHMRKKQMDIITKTSQKCCLT